MKQKTINLYQFNELSNEQKQKVLDKYRDFNDDIIESYANDELCMQEIWESGFIDAKPCYDLSYSQGSGACFDCNDFDFDLLLKDWQHKHKQWIINILKNYCEASIHKNQFANHYCHANTRTFEVYIRGMWSYPKLDKIILEIEKYIENLRYELSENLTDRLYQELEFLRSDEQIADALICNDYYFNSETLEIEE